MKMSDEEKDQTRAMINRLAYQMYVIASEHGFHKDDSQGRLAAPTLGGITVERLASFCSNLHGEVSELWEAARRGVLKKPCDKDCNLTCAEEELADIVIRVMDMAVALNVDLGRAIEIKATYNETRPYMHGKKA